MKRILFVCVENANRSQMAEAFARMHGARALPPAEFDRVRDEIERRVLDLLARARDADDERPGAA